MSTSNVPVICIYVFSKHIISYSQGLFSIGWVYYTGPEGFTRKKSKKKKKKKKKKKEPDTCAGRGYHSSHLPFWGSSHHHIRSSTLSIWNRCTLETTRRPHPLPKKGELIDNHVEFVVDKILHKRFLADGSIHYLVHWKDYRASGGYLGASSTSRQCTGTSGRL